MKPIYALCVGAAVLLAVSLCAGQPPSGKKSTAPPPKSASQPATAKQPEWKNLLKQASTAEQKGDVTKARTLLNRAYKSAPAGEDKAQVAFAIAGLCERSKSYDEARQWYLEAIYAAPKGPLARQARERMRAIPDSRRPAAAGASSAGGGAPRQVKPK